MAFGNYKIKADFGGKRITDRNSATAFKTLSTGRPRDTPPSLERPSQPVEEQAAAPCVAVSQRGLWTTGALASGRCTVMTNVFRSSPPSSNTGTAGILARSPD
jgi:hypothetical protein